jgi:hypothetical protein
MDIGDAVVLLAGLVILATTTVIVTGMALKDTAPQDRVAILRAIAQLVQHVRR